MSGDRNFHLSIGKVESRLKEKGLDIKSHTIRFWLTIFDHIQFETKKGDRRYFNEDSILEFEKIHKLSEQGLTLSGIKKRVKYSKIKEEEKSESDNVSTTKIVQKIDKIIEGINSLLAN